MSVVRNSDRRVVRTFWPQRVRIANNALEDLLQTREERSHRGGFCTSAFALICGKTWKNVWLYIKCSTSDVIGHSRVLLLVLQPQFAELCTCAGKLHIGIGSLSKEVGHESVFLGNVGDAPLGYSADDTHDQLKNKRKRSTGEECRKSVIRIPP